MKKIAHRVFVRNLVVFVLLLVSLNPSCFASDNDSKWSIITPSYTHHFYPRGKDRTEKFDNLFFAVTRKTDRLPIFDRVVVGTVNNSSDNQCVLIGGAKNWKQINARTSFKGLYAYVGEFFGGAFSQCGEDGIYKDIRGVTGVGFAPYIYHGVQLKLTDHIAINGGLILPGVASFAMEFTW